MSEQSYLLPPKEVTDIVAALEYLSGQCDGAVEEDHVGFNKYDTDYGKVMAMTGARMSNGQLIAVNKMLQKYRGQLSGAGLEIPTEDQLKKALKINEPQVDNAVTLHNQRVMVYFSKKPNAETRDQMKRVPGWRWEGELKGKPWSFPVRESKQVIALFQETHDIEQDVFEMAAGIPEEKEPPTVVRLEAHDGRILVHFPGTGKPPDEELDKVRSLPSRAWEKDLPGCPWSVPARYYKDLLERFPDCQISDEVRALMDERKELAEMGRSEETEFRFEGLNTEHGEPRPFQWATMAFMEAHNGRALVAEDQGLGKCLETCGYLQLHPEIRPVVIICPASVKMVWQREIAKWMTTEEQVVALKSQTPYPVEGSIFIINYEILQYWADEIRHKIKPPLIVADESQNLRNPEALVTKAAFKVVLGKERKKKTDRWSHTSKPVPYFFALSGTPIENKALDIWTTLHFLDERAWKSRHDFGVEFGMIYEGYFGWMKDGDPDVESLRKAIAPYVVRHKKEDVLPELPPKIHIPLPLEIGDKYKIEYMQEVQRVVDKIKELQAKHVPVGAEHMVMIEKLKQITARAKLENLIPWIQDTIQNEKLIVFATHTEIIAKIMEVFDGLAVEISGRVPPGPKRDASVDAFMNDDTIKLCVANINAGGVGLTLTAASRALFAEFPWNPKDLDQAEDRLHRFSQDRQVMIYFACAANTIDEGVVEILLRKATPIDEIMDGETGQTVDGLTITQEVVAEFMREAVQLGFEFE